MLFVFVFGYFVPFIIAISISNYYLQAACFCLCLFTFCVFGFAVFYLIRVQGFVEYLLDFGNGIDVLACAAFFILFNFKIVSQFQSDTFIEICIVVFLLVFSLFKILSLLRVYQEFCQFTIICQKIIKKVAPIGITYFMSLFVFTKCLEILHMGLEDNNQRYSFIGINFLKLLVQTYEDNIG